MIKMLLKMMFIGFITYFGYQYRYRVLNMILSVPFIRRGVVASSMNLPFLKDKMLESIFRYE
ncbi:hypothetical protein [Peribacillus tepidiphilus]|jgi:hypothetical protein|uniref:hypothetical protein n=1 Tax=Peribacillus tepidiphilus TaxID=2652445 RepID=UPI0035B56CB2